MLPYILFVTNVHTLALEMACRGNRHCANCIGTLSFHILICKSCHPQTRHMELRLIGGWNYRCSNSPDVVWSLAHLDICRRVSVWFTWPYVQSVSIISRASVYLLCRRNTSRHPPSIWTSAPVRSGFSLFKHLRQRAQATNVPVKSGIQ